MTALAEEMTRGAWREIVTELDHATPHATKVKLGLTNHVWCDLFIGLVQAIEMTRRGFDSIPITVRTLILGSALQADRPHVSEAVVGLIVDKAWHSIQAAAFAGAPLLDLISNEEALRALRILAVFICPAPAQHRSTATRPEATRRRRHRDPHRPDQDQACRATHRLASRRRRVCARLCSMHDGALVEGRCPLPPDNRQTPGQHQSERADLNMRWSLLS
ncbi:hypothetical protein ACLQ28_26165 [Micromonospora sp. DT201]|uniref:hypothetical protein n=1 Tax=Micromonospora sp. DT201 TaxID=3393442 RepID=UPI003CEC0E90